MDKSLSKILENHGIEVLPDNVQWKHRMEIHSESSNRVYVIAQRKSNGEFACSCPGWIRHRKCKHLTAIMPLIRQAGL